MLSGVSERKRNMYDFTYMWNVRNITKQKQSQRSRVTVRGKGRWVNEKKLVRKNRYKFSVIK